MGNEKTLKRIETEIFDQSYKMWAEGTSDFKPTEELVSNHIAGYGFISDEIDIWYDNLQHFWRWNCKISYPQVSDGKK